MESFNDIALKGIDYADKGKYELAIKEFDRALSINPSCSETLYNRGCVYSKMLQYDQAVADYDRSLAIDGTNFDALNNRGVAKQNKGDISGGNYDIEKSRKMREFSLNHPFLYLWRKDGFLPALRGLVIFNVVWGAGILLIVIAFRLLSRLWS